MSVYGSLRDADRVDGGHRCQRMSLEETRAHALGHSSFAGAAMDCACAAPAVPPSSLLGTVAIGTVANDHNTPSNSAERRLRKRWETIRLLKEER